MRIKDLIGTWFLTEWVRIGRSGAIEHPFTPAAMGRILYTGCGLMGGFLMHPAWPANTPGVTPLATRFISYSGRFVLADNIVTHHVDMASEPSWVGTSLRRAGTLTGAGLELTTLSSTDLADTDWLHHRLRFERAR